MHISCSNIMSYVITYDICKSELWAINKCMPFRGFAEKLIYFGKYYKL